MDTPTSKPGIEFPYPPEVEPGIPPVEELPRPSQGPPLDRPVRADTGSWFAVVLGFAVALGAIYWFASAPHPVTTASNTSTTVTTNPPPAPPGQPLQPERPSTTKLPSPNP
jgi:hypothetical protein